MPRPCPITEEQKTRLFDGYKSGKSATQLAREFSASKKFVLYTLHDAGIARSYREAKAILPTLALNHFAFAGDTLTEEAAYWIGFLMADGSVKRRGGNANVILQISECDEPHLERFKRFVGAANRIGYVHDKRGNTKPMRRICLVSTQMASDLERYGVVPRKAKTASVRLLESNRHFWRGVIDGDGSLMMKRRRNRVTREIYERRQPTLSVSGSIFLMKQFVAFCHQHATFTADVHRSHGNWGVTVSATPCRDVVRVLYADSHVSLERKHLLAEEIQLSTPGRIQKRR